MTEKEKVNDLDYFNKRANTRSKIAAPFGTLDFFNMRKRDTINTLTFVYYITDICDKAALEGTVSFVASSVFNLSLEGVVFFRDKVKIKVSGKEKDLKHLAENLKYVVGYHNKDPEIEFRGGTQDASIY